MIGRWGWWAHGNKAEKDGMKTESGFERLYNIGATPCFHHMDPTCVPSLPTCSLHVSHLLPLELASCLASQPQFSNWFIMAYNFLLLLLLYFPPSIIMESSTYDIFIYLNLFYKINFLIKNILKIIKRIVKVMSC